MITLVAGETEEVRNNPYEVLTVNTALKILKAILN